MCYHPPCRRDSRLWVGKKHDRKAFFLGGAIRWQRACHNTVAHWHSGYVMWSRLTTKRKNYYESLLLFVQEPYRIMQMYEPNTTWQGMFCVITQTISQHWQKPSLWTSQQRHPKGTRCPSWPRRCQLLPLLQGQWTLWLSWFCPPSWWGPLLTTRSRYHVRHPSIRCRTCWPLKSGSCSLLCKREMDKQSGNNKNYQKLHPLRLQIGLHAVWSLHRLEVAACWPANCRTSSQGPVCWAPRSKL